MKINKEKIINILFYFCIALIALLAVYLRLNVYLFNRSLWMDEAALANNLFLPNSILNNMQYLQAAPPLFKLVSLINVKIFGDNEYALRLFPLLCSFVSIPLFFTITTKIFKTKFAQIIAMIMFAINYMLIYYASEFKQYSTDVLCTLILVNIGLYFNPFEDTKKKFWLIALYLPEFFGSHTHH